MSRTRSAPPTGSRSSPGCASTASRSTSTTCAPLGGGEFGRRDHLWSPRLGLVLKPTDDLSFYASYSRSYLPQSGDQFSGLTDVTDGLKPERFDNYEVGAKWEILDGLLATAARLPARPHQHPRDRPQRPVAHRPDRRPAQPRARARPRTQRHQPLADLGRLYAAEGGDHRDHHRRAQGPRGAAGARATASRCGTATTSPSSSASASA